MFTPTCLNIFMLFQSSITIFWLERSKNGLLWPIYLFGSLVKQFLVFRVCYELCFFCLNRSTPCEILWNLGCPGKFVDLIRSLHDGVKARIDFSGALPDKIPVDNGVKQGDISASMLLTIYIRYRTSGKIDNIRRLLAHTKVSSSLVRLLLYVDDWNIVTHSEDEMQLFMNRVGHAFGLEINLEKKSVDMHDLVRLSVIWKSDLIDKMKRSFFQAAVVSILLYGCTTWTLIKQMEKKLDGNYIKMLRAILNKFWRQHPTSRKLSKLDEPDMRGTAGEVGTSS